MGAPGRAALAAVAAFAPAALGACPSCADALAHDPAGLGFARGVYYSIVVLFAVLGTLVTVLVRAVLKEARRRPDSTPPPGP